MNTNKYEDNKTKKEVNKMRKSVMMLGMLLLCCNLVYAKVDTTKAVIHHTASHDASVAEIDRWHKERGWDCIGYHFVIRKDGTIEEGRTLEKNGAHAKGRNHYVGIALTGYDTFTVDQINSLKTLLKRLGITHIEGHHENCPGPGIDLEQIQKEVQNGN